MHSPTRAIFLDRDGVINDVIDRGDDCVVSGKQVRWTAPWRFDEFSVKEGVVETLPQFRALGFLLILVTNQPDVAYGTMKREDYERIMATVRQLPFDDVVVCEHGRGDGCDCKKPKPGMLTVSAHKWGIDLSHSYMIGDTSIDVDAGRAAGCTTILVDRPYNTHLAPDYRVRDLAEAVLLLQGRIR